VQRHLLEEDYLTGVNAADLAALHGLAAQHGASLAGDDPLAAQLQGICDAVLSEQRVSAHDSLFDAGISSLKLVALHERIEQHWPGVLDITDIFDHPSIAELAHCLEERLNPGAGNARGTAQVQ